MGKIQEFVNNFFLTHDLEKLHQDLQELDMQELSKEEKLDWYYHLTKVLILKKKFAEGLQNIEEALIQFPNKTIFYFQIGNIEELKGNPEMAIKNFKKMNYSETGPDCFLRAAQVCYLWNKFEDGLQFLEPIFKHYQEIKIIDDHYLYMNGMPFYSDVFAHLAVLSKLSQNLKLLDEELMNLNRFYNDRMQNEIIKKRWTAFSTGDWNPILNSLKTEYVKDEDALRRFDEFSFTKLIILKSRTELEYDKAIEILEQVKFSNNDFPWLPHLIILAKAELAHRFGKNEEEQELIGKFMDLQPCLFSLNVVFIFGFDNYQESLKKKYQDQVFSENKSLN